MSTKLSVTSRWPSCMSFCRTIRKTPTSLQTNMLVNTEVTAWWTLNYLSSTHLQSQFHSKDDYHSWMALKRQSPTTVFLKTTLTQTTHNFSTTGFLLFGGNLAEVIKDLTMLMNWPVVEDFVEVVHFNLNKFTGVQWTWQGPLKVLREKVHPSHHAFWQGYNMTAWAHSYVQKQCIHTIYTSTSIYYRKWKMSAK